MSDVSGAPDAPDAPDAPEARAVHERLRALEGRHRIAQDLHDDVIQRLFAIGVGLQSLAGAGLGPAAEARLARHVDELDATIEQIRTSVFEPDAVPRR